MSANAIRDGINELVNRNGLFLSLAMVLPLLAGSAEAAGSRSDEGARLFAARKFEQARLSLEAAVRDDPTDALAASYLGRVYLAQGSPDLAVEWMEKSIALEPSSAEYHLWLGRAYGYQAIRASVLKQPALAKKVRKEFEQASGLDPDNLEARFGLIEFYLRAPGILGGSEKKAKEQARRGPQARRAAGISRVRPHRRAPKGLRSERSGSTSGPAREFPEKAEPAYWTGALYARRKDYAKAFEVYEKLLEKNPSEMAACYQIGRVAALSGQRLERGAGMPDGLSPARAGAGRAVARLGALPAGTPLRKERQPRTREARILRRARNRAHVADARQALKKIS